MKLKITVLLAWLSAGLANAQLKFVIEDFEGMALSQSEFRQEGVFTFGSAEASVDQKTTKGYGYSGDRSLRISWNQKKLFGGWGKGITMYTELNRDEDYLNFYAYSPKSNGRNDRLKVTLEEDDNSNSIFEDRIDDSWQHTVELKNSDDWQLIAIPLSGLTDANAGGDGKFNVNHREGKLLTFIISFADTNDIRAGQKWYFDFVCFSKGKLPTWAGKFVPPAAPRDEYCHLGVWSEEGKEGNLLEIPYRFESIFKGSSDKKVGVAHFFMPFSIGGPKGKHLYPDPDKITWIMEKGYIPMVTLEHQHIKVRRNEKQPNLYSIVEGHFDFLFREWANRLKMVKGPILLRILHEFNGDWYPWCISQNDNNPELYVKAYRHVKDIFDQQGATNIKFVWCPNSTSFPQASWNYIMLAYPGDNYVDYVGLDVYNGAGKVQLPVWTSFRKEAAANYFLLRDRIPEKPVFICEVSSRERKNVEKGELQDKAAWIAQMSEALKSDFSGVKLLCWFNQYEWFKVNSSADSRNAYLRYILQDKYFRSGTEGFLRQPGVSSK
jgi:hypothetical protein